MSDRQAAEGPAFWSPAARRESAGGVGDRQGVEGSQAAASEKEDLENTKVSSPLASASDPEPRPSPYRPQMVSPASKDTTEGLQKAAGASEVQAPGEQELLPAGPVQVHTEMAKYQAPQRPEDTVMIQSEHTGAVDVLATDLESADLLGDHRKVSPPLMAPPCIWTFAKVKEFKSKLGKEKNSRLVVSDSSEDEDEEEEEEEEIEEPVPVGDVERGSRSSLRGRYGEVMPVYRRDSHRDVQAGSHDYPGEGIYLLKFDNSYSLLRNKTLYFHIYYTS
ncbi:protein TMED8 isoform X3 [Arvicola amphibius]|uniref:protein TMED8 isoform X3 n=1 Tax=Arvicola amphibius TaxID=1047088 RepID=UPI0018E2F1A4|nr:protein TMED8 isoform X3 [Arvicola amphibius]